MATRQELYTAIGLIRRTCRLNGVVPSFAKNMEYSGPYGEDERYLDFAAQDKDIKVWCNIMDTQAIAIDTVLQKVDSKFLDNGINYIPAVATRPNLENDEQAVKALMDTAKPLIDVVISQQDFSSIKEPFKSYHSECGTSEPDPWAIIETESNYANILHDIIDAMRYELQGIHSATGEPHNWSVDFLRKMIASRVFTGWIYYSKLTDPQLVGIPSKADMGAVLSYVETTLGLGNAGTLSEFDVVGKWIDTEMPDKLQMVRRWWAL